MRSSRPTLSIMLLAAAVCLAPAAWPAGEKDGVLSALTTALDIGDGSLSVNVATNGRFNLGLHDTGGDWDLLYRWPGLPGTSFTTLRVDGVDSRYGTDGTLIEAPTDVDARTNRSRWSVGDVEIEQTLSIVANPFSASVNTLRVEYAVTNTGSVPRPVGLRLMLDTELNYNDGAPFRIPGGDLVTHELELTGAAVPASFQVFFSAADAQRVGTAILSGYGATPPDRLVIAAWPRIWATRFDFTPLPAQSILSDSAYAAYWLPATLAAGETRRYVTFYGPASLTADPRPPLALTLSSPLALEVAGGAYAPNPFDVVFTMRNVGAAVAQGVVARLTLPTGLALDSGTSVVPVGVLTPGQERQVSWRVRAQPRSDAAALGLIAGVSADNADPKELRRDVFVPSLLASCESLFGVSSRNVHGRRCADILSDANRLSAAANPPAGPGRTAFSRDEVELFFDAVECRTGVPAPLLRAYSFEEATGVYYADPYPRQFIEPCEQSRNRNGNVGYLELWQRYYGVGCPVGKSHGACVEVASEAWPLLAVGAVNAGCDLSTADCPAEQPAPGLGIAMCTLFPEGDCKSTDFVCAGAAPDPDPTDGFDAPGIGGTPPAPAPADAAWHALAPALVHVTLGDDRPGSQSFGLGLTQVTMYIDDIAPFDNITYVRGESTYPGDGQPNYPKGGGRPFGGGLGIAPLGPDAVAALIHDPQFNVLVGAELVAIKWQQLTDAAAGVTECQDADYGRVITLHAAPPFVGADQATRDLWTCSVGSIKAGSPTCQVGGPALVKATVDYDLASNLNAVHRCFGQFYNDRLANGCRAAQRHAFAFACNDLRSYYGKSFPDDDPCRALIEQYRRP